MKHIDDFTIHSFRGLRDLKIENIGQVNLFVGDNNSGKTSVLEAASIFCDPLNWRKWYDLGVQRDMPTAPRTSTIDRLTWLFPWDANVNHGASLENTEILLSAAGNSPIKKVTASYEKVTEMISIPISNTAKLDERLLEERDLESENIKISVSVTPKHMQQRLFGTDEVNEFKQILTFSDYRLLAPAANKQQKIMLPSQIVNPFSHRTSELTARLWSEVVEANLKTETIELLRFFDPAIQDVDLISPTERRPQISIKHKKLGRAPLSTFGDGLRRVFTLAASIPRVRGGLLLVDELETAIHTKALEKTFNWLVSACVKNNVQIFATTHSLEALDAVMEASREQAELVIYRLQQNKTQTTTTRFDKEMTLRLREELGMELRY